MRTIVLTAVLAVAACKGENAREATGAIVGKGVEITKSIGTGIGDGIEKGRRDAVSADGSRVLSAAADVLQAVDLEVHDVAAGASPKTVIVTLAVSNKTATPLHLIGLQAQGGALLLDKEGFATPMTPSAPGQLGEAIVVPPNAKVKASLEFVGTVETSATVRVWGKDLPVPAKK